MSLSVILKLIYMLCYFLLACQGGFYLLAFYRVISDIDADTFLQLRKTTDAVTAVPLKLLYISTLLQSIVLLLLDYRNIAVIEYILYCAGFVLLATDMLLAIKVSVPLNKMINDMVAGSKEIESVRIKWVNYILIRGMLTVLGFTALLITALISGKC